MIVPEIPIVMTPPGAKRMPEWHFPEAGKTATNGRFRKLGNSKQRENRAAAFERKAEVAPKQKN